MAKITKMELKFSNLFSLSNYLSNGIYKQPAFWNFCQKEFVYRYEYLNSNSYNKYPMHSVRILYGYTNPIIEFFGDRKIYVGALDYYICEDKVHIEYMNCDDPREKHHKNPLFDVEEAKLMIKSLIAHSIHITKANNKPKLVGEVHANLRIFNQDYKPHGFEVTNRKCKDNPYWREVELIIDPVYEVTSQPIAVTNS